jgi:ABC-type multidrug transport system fused ATPase/permease subunit
MLFETMGHAKRVFEYVDLPAEESTEGISYAADQKIGSAHNDLALRGDLEFKNYSMSYRESTPIIINELNLQIKEGSKVGLVGRTGSGKTSLVQALFRMVYVRGGDITVGGRSILGLPVDKARALFAVVPQDPYLFEGTLRSNIDRQREFSNEKVKEALLTVGLSFDLEMAISEGGSNLSVGQRQLVCLARVILAKQPFVLLDEPTSGVDTITDAIIQRVLREALADRTVITIAHRLETLARMERVIELRDGRVVG